MSRQVPLIAARRSALAGAFSLEPLPGKLGIAWVELDTEPVSPVALCGYGDRAGTKE